MTLAREALPNDAIIVTLTLAVAPAPGVVDPTGLYAVLGRIGEIGNAIAHTATGQVIRVDGDTYTVLGAVRDR